MAMEFWGAYFAHCRRNRPGKRIVRWSQWPRRAYAIKGPMDPKGWAASQYYNRPRRRR